MDRAYHPAWREAIIPFLDDQRKLDQLWCSSKVLQRPILTAGKQITCWCRPMDSPIKNRGIYPSYLNMMTNLRAVTVKLEPRLESTWIEYTQWQSGALELFADSIPTSVNRFETDIMDVYWGKLTKEQRIEVLKVWLDRFTSIELGEGMKHFIYYRMMDDFSVIASNLEWLRYQYITIIDIPKLRLLLSSLAQKGDDVLTIRFITGIATLRVQNDPRATGRVDFTGPDDPYIGMLYQMLPNLRVIVGYMPYLPVGLQKYVVNGTDSPQSGSISALPDSLETLMIPWYILNFDRLSFPHTITEIRLDNIGGSMQMTPLQFIHLILALPPFLKVLGVTDFYPKDRTLDYWLVQNIRVLPRRLEKLYVTPHQWSIPGDQAATIARLQALPQDLTELSLPISGVNYGLDPIELLYLPPSLTNLALTMNSEYLSTFDQNILHFTQLKILTLVVDLPPDYNFPEVILPAGLENLILSIVALGNEALSVPLRMIRWPEQMKAMIIVVHDDAYLEEDEIFSISQWHLPRKLSELNLEGIGVKVLPPSWPIGLNTFTCNITGGLSGISDVWPDIGRMAYYLPDSTLCYTAIYDHTYNRRTISIRNNPQTGRPEQRVDDGEQ